MECVEPATPTTPTVPPRTKNWQTPKTQNNVDRLICYLTEHGPSSSLQLGQHLGFDLGTMSRYLRHMRDTKLIRLVQTHCTEPNRARPALYGLFDEEENINSSLEDLPVLIRKTSKWKSGNATRDPLVAALFGPSTTKEAP
jgi:hypothetical protein